MNVGQDAPSKVRTAIILFWVAVLLALGEAIAIDYVSKTSTVGTLAIGLAIFGLVIFRASRRHNWARYVLLIWTILGSMIYAANFELDARPAWDHLLIVASFAVQIVAACLLFTSGAAQWFRQKGVA